MYIYIHVDICVFEIINRNLEISNINYAQIYNDVLYHINREFKFMLYIDLKTEM